MPQVRPGDLPQNSNSGYAFSRKDSGSRRAYENVMTDIVALHPPAEDEIGAMLALNNAHAKELGALTEASLRALLATSFRVRTAGKMDGFLIALDEGAAYDSPNFLWFCARYPHFAYIDRVVVAEYARGRGIARLLYEDLFDAAAQAGHAIVCCEVNYDPPNPGSDAFHRALGFAEVGRATLADRGKSVRYLTRGLGTAKNR